MPACVASAPISTPSEATVARLAERLAPARGGARGGAGRPGRSRSRPRSAAWPSSRRPRIARGPSATSSPAVGMRPGSEWNATRGEAEGLETRVAGRRQQRSVREARVAQLARWHPGSPREMSNGWPRSARTSRRRRPRHAMRMARRPRPRSEPSPSGPPDGPSCSSWRGTRAGEERGSGSWSARHRPRPSRPLVGTRRWPHWRGSASWRWTGSRRRPRRRRATRSRRWTTSALEQEVRRVRRTLAQIGSVNPFAVEEHREVAARLEEMSGQDADLRGAIESTEELIATLDAEIEKQFDAAFRAIGEKFDEFCRLLFAGGSASLQRRTRPMATRRAASRSSSGRPASGCSASRCSPVASEP